jgi:hypothetical protein
MDKKDAERKEREARELARKLERERIKPDHPEGKERFEEIVKRAAKPKSNK